MEVAKSFCLQVTDLNLNTVCKLFDEVFYCTVEPPLVFSLPPATVLLFSLSRGESKEMHWSEQAESIVLICVVYCTVSASRENGKLNGSFLSHRRSACCCCAFCVTQLDSRSDWNTGGVKGVCARIDPLWNKVSNGPPWNWQGLFPSMSPLMLNHRRPPPTNPSAEIPGFVDLSLLIDTKWSVSLLMNLWNQVVTIYFIPNNFFQTVLPCLSLCLTWVLIKGPVMCLKCRHPRPADRTQSKGRQVGSLSSTLPCPVPARLLVYTQVAWIRQTKQE